MASSASTQAVYDPSVGFNMHYINDYLPWSIVNLLCG